MARRLSSVAQGRANLQRKIHRLLPDERAPTDGVVLRLGVAMVVALSSALLGKPLKGGLAIVGGITLGGSIEQVHNPVDVVELALEKGAGMVQMPVSCRRALVDLSDDVAARVQVVFYLDAADALRKAIHDS